MKENCDILLNKDPIILDRIFLSLGINPYEHNQVLSFEKFVEFLEIVVFQIAK